MFINKDIYINRELLEKIIRNFYEIVKLQIGVWDSDGNVFYGYPDSSTFCQKINIDLKDRKYCHRYDQIAAFKCNETLKPYSYICHAGAYELVVPLIFEGKCRMYVVFGQCACLETEALQRATMIKYCKHKGIPLETLETDFNKLPRYSQSYLNAVAELASLCFQSMWDNRIIEVRKDDFLIQIDKFILDNIKNELTINDLCAEFHISKNTLYSLFKEYYKMTINNYITLKRLELAKQYLVNSDLTITEIAEKIGKKNYNDFIQMFKKHELISPSKYRHLHKITP